MQLCGTKSAATPVQVRELDWYGSCCTLTPAQSSGLGVRPNSELVELQTGSGYTDTGISTVVDGVQVSRERGGSVRADPAWLPNWVGLR